MYPTLIVHEEANAFDAEAILYFLRNYHPSRVTLVGEIPDALETLLIAPQSAGGAGIPLLYRETDSGTNLRGGR